MASEKSRLRKRSEVYQKLDPSFATDELLRLLEEDLNDEGQVQQAFDIHREAAHKRLVR